MHRQLLEFPGKVLASGSTSSRAYYDLKPLKPRHGRPRITRRYKKAFKVPLASQSNDILSTCRFKDPVTGLMPDTVSALYFLEDVKETKDTQVTSLRGIVRFGAQATGSTLPDWAAETGRNWKGNKKGRFFFGSLPLDRVMKLVCRQRNPWAEGSQKKMVTCCNKWCCLICAARWLFNVSVW